MVYLLDLVAILFIVVLSFFFCMSNDKIKNNTNNSTCLLSHIVVGLSVIVFYKLAKHFKLNDKLNNKFNYTNTTNTTNNKIIKEMFDDSVTKSINDFITGSNTEIISSQQATTLSPAQLSDYSNKLDTLIKNINNLQSTINSPNPLSGTNPGNLNTLDLESQQQYQMFQIDYLNKQIKNAQDVINAQNVADSNTNYKPIKVFSSCIVSNTNGTTTNESKASNPNQSSLTASNGLQQSNDSQSASTQQILNTISQANTQSGGVRLSPSTGGFQNAFSNLQNFSSINVN